MSPFSTIFRHFYKYEKRLQALKNWYGKKIGRLIEKWRITFAKRHHFCGDLQITHIKLNIFFMNVLGKFEFFIKIVWFSPFFTNWHTWELKNFFEKTLFANFLFSRHIMRIKCEQNDGKMLSFDWKWGLRCFCDTLSVHHNLWSEWRLIKINFTLICKK